MRYKALTMGVLIVLSVCWFAFNTLADEKGVTKDTIKIGLFGPLTGPYQQWYKMGYECGVIPALEEVNRSGGIHGRKFELIAEDDGFVTSQSLMAVRKLIDKGVFAIIGGINSPGVEACRGVVASEQIPLFTPTTGGDSFLLPYNTDPSGRWIFGGTFPTQRIQGSNIVDFAVKKGAKRIGIIYHSTSWGKDGYEGASNRMKEHRLKFVAEENSLPDPTDLSVQILKLKEKECDFVVNMQIPRPTMIFVRQAKELGLKATICGPGGSLMDPSALAKAVGIGALTDFYYLIGIRGLATGPGVAEWRLKLEKARPEEVGKGSFPDAQTLSAAGGALAFVEGFKRAGPDLTRIKYRDVLESMKDFETGILSGPISFSPTNHIGLHRTYIIKFDGEKQILVK